MTYGQGFLLTRLTDTLRALNPATGATDWSVSFPGQMIPNPATAGAVGLGIASSGSTACFINQSSSGPATFYLTCVDLATKSTRWQLAGAYVGTPSIRAGRVYAASGSTIQEIDVTSGTVLFTYTAPTWQVLRGQPVLTDDSIIIAGASTTFIFSYQNALPRQQLPEAGVISAARGRVFIGASFSGTKSLYCYGGLAVASLPAPVIQDQQFTGEEDLSLPLTLEATDPGGVQFRVQTLPASGSLFQTPDGTAKGSEIKTVPTVVTNAAGKLLFIPTHNVTGAPATSFKFCAFNTLALSQEATVSISLTPVSDAPIAVNDQVALRPGESLTAFQPMANDIDPDGDSLTIVSHTQPDSGLVTLEGGNLISYSPLAAGHLAGEQVFHYTIRDSSGQESTASIKISIRRPASDGWLEQGGSATHAGFSGIVLGPSPFTQSWQNLQTSYDSQPAVAAGTVFASHYGSVRGISAYDLASGWKRWQVTPTDATSITPPVVHSGNLYFQWAISGLYGSTGGTESIDAVTAQRVWMRPFSNYSSSTFSPSVTDSAVFVTSNSPSSLISYDHAGRMRTYTALGNIYPWIPTAVGDSVYGFSSGVFRAFFQRTGVQAWETLIDLPEYSSNSLMAAEGNYSAFSYTSSATSRSGVVCMNLATKKLQWEISEPSYNGFGMPAIAQGRVYVCRNGSGVEIYDADTGLRQRQISYPSSGKIQEQPIVTADSIIVPGSTVTTILDLTTGAVRQTLPQGGSIALHGHSLIIRSSDKIACYQCPDLFDPPPTANAQTVSGTEDVAAEITLTGQGEAGEQLTYFVTTLPTTGTLHQLTSNGVLGAPITSTPSLVTNGQNKLVLIPQRDLSGTDASVFGYAISDGQRLSPPASVSIDLASVNDAPVAVDDKVFTRPGDTLSPVGERLNDIDIDHDALAVTAFTQPTHGTVTIDGTGILRYEASDSVSNIIDTFSYTVSDPSGAVSSAEVTVFVDATLQGEWSTAGGTATRAGHSPVRVPIGPFTQSWQTLVPGNTIAQPTVAEGSVYLSVWDAGQPRVTAFSLTTGVQQWSTVLIPFSFYVEISSTSYHDGIVYAGASYYISNPNIHRLVALDARSGEIVWWQSQPNTNASSLAPAVGPNGIFTSGGTSYGGLQGRSLAGDLLFSIGEQSYGQWRPSLYGSRLYTLSTFHLTSLSPETGATEWNFTLPTGNQFSETHVALGEGCAVFTNQWTLYCVDLTRRALRWSQTSRYRGNPIISNGLVFAANGESLQTTPCSVSAFDLTTGTPVGTYATPNGSSLVGDDSIIATDDMVIFGTSSNTHIYNRHTGALVQTIPMTGGFALAGSTLILNTSGKLTAFTAPDPITFSPPAGNYAAPVSVTLAAATPFTTIHYTLDGSVPRLSSPSVLSGTAIPIASSSTIRAFAASGTATSTAQVAPYTISLPFAEGLPSPTEPIAGVDTDHDGQPDAVEVLAGSNPTDGADTFSISGAKLSSDGKSVDISWPSVPGQKYQLQCSSDLNTWSNVSASMTATSTTMIQNVALQPDSRCFFRVMLE